MLTTPLVPAPNPSTEQATEQVVAALPADFLFGASTAAYQIEGAAQEDGRGRSVWDDFCEVPGAVRDGSSGAVACDSYHRYGEDVALLRDLGVGAYRFSIAWPRIQPTGTGEPNAAGLDYYDRLVDALLAAGIKPAATLFHWDLPSALQERGGWLERDTALRFADYATHVAGRLGDRVAMWMPVNEPNVVTLLGHGTGAHAPGLALGFGALTVAHHLLLGHGLAVTALRQAGIGPATVGCVNNHQPIWPASEDPADQFAAALFDAVTNRLFAEPMVLGSFPAELTELLDPQATADLAAIAAPMDFYGVNSYNPIRIAAPGSAAAAEATGPTGSESIPDGMPFVEVPVTGYPVTDFGWPVVPAAFGQLLVDLSTRYPDIPPLYVTENGCSDGTGPGPDGQVHDVARVDFYAQHLRALGRARAAGADVRGYFAWSLLDNFEWAEGYQQRFGLTWVDFQTQQRLPKDSFRWLADVIRRVRAGS